MNIQHLALIDLLDTRNIVENCRKLEELLSNGKILQEVLGFSSELMNEKQLVAAQAYQEHNYENARNVYAYLVMLNPYVMSFWMGLAASQMRLEQYNDAVKSYSMATVVNSNDPTPLYFASYPYLKLGQTADAAKSLALAVEIAKKDHQYFEIERQSLDLLEKIKKSTS